MSLFQFLRPDVGNIMSGITQQKGVTDNVMQTLKSYPAIVKQTWIGGDALTRMTAMARAKSWSSIASVSVDRRTTTRLGSIRIRLPGPRLPCIKRSSSAAAS